MRYFGYQLYKGDDGTVDLQVDTDPAALFATLAEDLNHCRQHTPGLETLEIGQVEADSVDAALDEIRAERWIDGTHGYTNGVAPEHVE